MKSIKMFVLTSISVGLSGTSLAKKDEYRYIDTPKAVQVADLTDDDRDGVVNASASVTSPANDVAKLSYNLIPPISSI